MTSQDKINEAARLLTEVSEDLGCTVRLASRHPDASYIDAGRRIIVTVERPHGKYGTGDQASADLAFCEAVERLEQEEQDAFDLEQAEREFAEWRARRVAA